MLLSQMELRTPLGSELIFEISHGIVMLASQFTLELMKDNTRQVFSDGSFKYCPAIMNIIRAKGVALQ